MRDKEGEWWFRKKKVGYVGDVGEREKEGEELWSNKREEIKKIYNWEKMWEEKKVRKSDIEKMNTIREEAR